jgi:hypothetical protein
MKRVLACLLCAWALGGQPAAANSITFGFTGTITQVPALDPVSPFPDPIDFGTPFSGTYTFDSTAADAIADPSAGSFASPGGSFTLTLSGLSLTFAGPSIVTIDSPGFDFYSALYSENPSNDNPTGVLLSITLQDLLGLALSSDALPLTPPPLAMFQLSNSFFFTDTIDGNQVEVGGDLTSLTCIEGCSRTVPEPTTWTLLLLAALLCAMFARRRNGRRPCSPPITTP